MPWFVIVVVILILDQITKWLVIQKINLYETIPVIDQLFYLSHIRNTGAAWNIFGNKTLFLAIFSGIVIVMILVYFPRNKQAAIRLPLSLILGGAIGNFFDRVFRGSVVDFLQLHFGNYIFPSFNIADSCICIGVVLLLINILVRKEALDR